MLTVGETQLPGFKLLARGKVRDIYDLGDRLLLVATDRISAFDVVLPQPVPDKGKVLHQLSMFWFDWAAPLIESHLITGRAAELPPALAPHRDVLAGRSALVRKAKMFPVECVARGYIAGSGWTEYQATGRVCGVQLPAGLAESARLPAPIFTPATKADAGHDVNISFEQTVDLVGRDVAARLRELTLALYAAAADYAERRGVIIADTKFEFGLIDGEITLCDEALTPDSSRFWPQAQYSPGGPQPSFDKQYVRDWLLTVNWNKTPPAPDLPPDVVEGTRKRYLEIFEILTGRGLAE